MAQKEKSKVLHSNRDIVGPGSREYRNEDAVWGPGSEAVESAKQWEECEKNPGHDKFIPVWDFGAHHLPKLWREDDFVELIKVWCNLHVRIRIRINKDPDRADDGGSYIPEDGGQRVGTGFLLSVSPPSNNCACVGDRCWCRAEQGQRSWTLQVSTAKHIVNENSDLGNMYVDFFNDYDGCGEEQKVTVRDREAKVVFTDSGWDWCVFTCVCDDVRLAALLLDHVERRKRLQEKTRSWMELLSPRPHIYVSYPHGKPKYVTVGELSGWEQESGMWTYTTDTCPGVCGSSAVGRRGSEWGYRGVHHCRGSADGGLNKGFDSWM